jgi:DNA-binding beta-propeller fold protein YncE
VGVARTSLDGSRLYVAQASTGVGPIDVIDAQTLQTVAQSAPQRVYDLFVTASGVYASVAYERPGDLYFLSGKVIRHDQVTLSPGATWDFLLVPGWIGVSRDEQALYAQGSDQQTLVVPLTP